MFKTMSNVYFDADGAGAGAGEPVAPPTDGADTPPVTPPVTDPAPAAPKDTTILGTAKSAADPTQQVAPESYDFKAVIPEGFEFDQARADSFAALAKNAGLSQERASEIAAYGVKLMQESAQGVQNEFVNRVNNWGEQAKTELGSEFTNTVRQAAVGIEVIEKQIPELRTMFAETGAGNHPVMIKAMAMIGKLVGEENGNQLLAGQSQSGGKSIYDKTDFGKY